MDDILERLLMLAKDAFDRDEIPVSAIVVRNGEIIGEGINSRERSNSVTGHAEINAINEACGYVGDWRLSDCDMYVTLLPCMMCTGAIIESRIKNVYYLCNKTNVRFNSSEFIKPILITNEKYCEKYLNLLQLFFENKRK